MCQMHLAVAHISQPYIMTDCIITHWNQQKLSLDQKKSILTIITECIITKS